MSDWAPEEELPADFSGVVRLFPLPNLVMFPHVLQALHIFESRYREMLEDALQGDRLIAMGLLRSGWEIDYEGRPPIEPTVCVGRVVSHVQLENGCYNLVLAGLQRARVEYELAPVRSFRQLQVAVIDDFYPPEGASRRPKIQRQLAAYLEQLLSSAEHLQEQLKFLLNAQLPLGVLTDILAHSSQLQLSRKMELLAETNVDRRAERLVELFRGGEGWGQIGDFPPPFSEN